MCVNLKLRYETSARQHHRKIHEICFTIAETSYGEITHPGENTRLTLIQMSIAIVKRTPTIDRQECIIQSNLVERFHKAGVISEVKHEISTIFLVQLY